MCRLYARDGMTAQATDSIEETLRDALRIRKSVADLERYSGAVALLALNAKISAAKLGIRGRPFKALTHEITKTSFNLNAIGDQIRELTHRLTCIMAKSLQLAHRSRVMGEAAALCGPNSSARAPLAHAHEQSQLELRAENARYPKMLRELRMVAEELANALRILEYVKTGLLVESSHLARNHIHNPFLYLATELDEATARIRQITESVVGSCRLKPTQLGAPNRSIGAQQHAVA